MVRYMRYPTSSSHSAGSSPIVFPVAAVSDADERSARKDSDSDGASCCYCDDDLRTADICRYDKRRT